MYGGIWFALLGLVAASPAFAAKLGTDSQFWGEVDISAAPASGWRITAMLVSRDGEGLPDPTLRGGGVIVDRSFGDLTISVGDLGVVARSPVSGARLDVDLPLAAVSYAWHIGGFEVADRNRLEDLIGVPGDPWRYRNRLSVERTVRGAEPLSSLFASEEVFYDLQTHQFTRSRAQAGFGTRVAPDTELRLFYLRQDDRSSVPRAVNALGCTLALDLR